MGWLLLKKKERIKADVGFVAALFCLEHRTKKKMMSMCKTMH